MEQGKPPPIYISSPTYDTTKSASPEIYNERPPTKSRRVDPKENLVTEAVPYGNADVCGGLTLIQINLRRFEV